MKHGKRPTRKQKQLLSAAGKVAANWLVCSDTAELMICENKHTGTICKIRKELYREKF